MIVEDDELFFFRVGPRELLVDGDLDYARFGGYWVRLVLRALASSVNDASQPGYGNLASRA